MNPPLIANSTKDERERYIRNTFRCRGNCDSCDLCRQFKCREPVVAFEEFIRGSREFEDVMNDYQK